MGRRRHPENQHLPERIYLRHGTYYFHPKGGKPIWLGRADANTWGDFDHYRKMIVEFRPSSYAKQLFRVARRSASCRHLVFAITLHDVEVLLQQSNYRCSVSGVPFSYERIEGARVRPWIPSIDRISNAKGYEPGNCRVVCAYVNIALNTFGEAALATVVRHMRIKNLENIRLSNISSLKNEQPEIASV